MKILLKSFIMVVNFELSRKTWSWGTTDYSLLGYERLTFFGCEKLTFIYLFLLGGISKTIFHHGVAILWKQALLEAFILRTLRFFKTLRRRTDILRQGNLKYFQSCWWYFMNLCWSNHVRVFRIIPLGCCVMVRFSVKRYYFFFYLGIGKNYFAIVIFVVLIFWKIE